MAKELMKEKSVEQLYDYPESGVMNKELCFLVLSVEKKESNRVYVELTDLKYKIRNVILISKEEIRVGDYILCKEFNYKYEKDVTITVNNFEKFGNNSLAFLMDLNEFKKDELIDCYFIFRKESKDFRGFNGETLEFEDDIKQKIKIEESKIYLFHRLQKLNEKKN